MPYDHERAASEARARAKKTFTHYMTLLAEREGRTLDSDFYVEISGIVDDIIDAAVHEARSHIEREARRG